MPPSAIAVRALVIDFDGTICPQDVSEELLDVFAGGEWNDIDLRFQRGEIGSRECIVEQAALVEAGEAEMLELALARYAVQPSFPPFATWARGEGIEVTVASDGMGFFIEPMLRAAGVEGVTVRTNEFAARPARGDPARMRFPNAHPICVGCGTCKMNVVLDTRRRLGPVAFVGEGHTDRYGALYADLVFASQDLVEICRADGVPFREWQTFDDVRAALEATATGAGALPGPVAPDPCPGWQVRR